MAHTTRFAALSLLVLLVSLMAVPAMAAESGTESGESGTESEEELGTSEPVDFEYMPATVIDEPPPDPVQQPWTTKFLVPTGLALAAVAVFVTVIQYFVRVVRSRYKVVE